MRLRSVSMLSPALLGLLPALAGCGGDAGTSSPDLGESAEEIISLSSPASGPSNISATLPGSNMLAVPTSSATADVTASSIHDARFSDGRTLGLLPGSDPVAWRDGMASDGFAAPPALGPRIDEALAAANSKADASLTSSAAEAGFLAMLALFGGTASTSIGSTFSGYQTPRARWLSRFDSTVYPEPQLFAEARMRGARMYCSAREMARKQASRGKRSMGAQALAELRIFGNDIDLMVFEPTFLIDDPQRFTNGTVADGAQAFTIPVQVGSKLTPIGNVGLPGMGEVRTPVVYVSADGEVQNATALNWSTGNFRRRYRTATHGDAVITRNADVQLFDAADIPLFTVGVVNVTLGVNAHAKVGTLTHLNTRELSHSGGVPFGLAPRPPVAGGSVVGVKYNDSPFRIESGVPTLPSPVDPGGSPGIQILQRVPSGDVSIGLFPVSSPMLARGLQDDDHTIQVQHSLGMGATLAAGVGLNFGFFALEVQVGGGLNVDGGQIQELRDAMILENQQPTAVLTATPRGFVQADWNAFAKLHIKIGPFDFSEPIFDTGPQALARHDGAPWPEYNRVRMGISSGSGTPMTRPNVMSHLPQDEAGAYASFPVGNDVNSCLVDDTPNPETPPPCAPTPPGGTRPQINVCARAHAPSGYPFPADVCTDPVGYADTIRADGWPEPIAQCFEQALGHVCAPTSTQIGSTTVSHVTNLTPGTPDPEMEASMSDLLEIMTACEAAIGPGAAEAFFSFGVCNSKGGDFSPNQPAFVVTTSNPTIHPGTCNE